MTERHYNRDTMALGDEDKRWISEQLEGVETRLLTAFHQWASPVDTRMRAHSAAIRALDVEPEVLRDRVDKIEGGRQRPSSLSPSNLYYRGNASASCLFAESRSS